MSSKESIASQALTLLAVNPINDFANDDSNEAEMVRMHWDRVVQSLISRHKWTFATKKTQLSQDTIKPINEYKYSYILPNDLLKLLAVYNSKNVGAMPINDFDLIATQGPMRLTTDADKIYIEYNRVPLVAHWPTYFQDLVVHALAAELAIPLTENTEKYQLHRQIAFDGRNNKLAVAITQDNLQYSSEIIVDNPFVNVRYG